MGDAPPVRWADDGSARRPAPLNRSGTITIATLVDVRPLELAWGGVRDAVESPGQPFLIRVARRCGLPEPASVLLAATASLRSAWLVGAFLALSFATLAVSLSAGRMLAPFLLSHRWSPSSASPRPTAPSRTRWSRWW